MAKLHNKKLLDELKDMYDIMEPDNDISLASLYDYVDGVMNGMFEKTFNDTMDKNLSITESIPKMELFDAIEIGTIDAPTVYIKNNNIPYGEDLFSVHINNKNKSIYLIKCSSGHLLYVTGSLVLIKPSNLIIGTKSCTIQYQCPYHNIIDDLLFSSEDINEKLTSLVGYMELLFKYSVILSIEN